MMNSFIKGAVRIGILQPKQRVIKSFSQNDVWQQVADDFFQAGQNIKWAINETERCNKQDRISK